MTNPDYFVVMVDYGKTGREAVVDLNHSRTDALDLVREALGDDHQVLFVHHIHDCGLEVITDDLLAEANALREPEQRHHATQEQMWDRARDSRNEAA